MDSSSGSGKRVIAAGCILAAGKPESGFDAVQEEMTTLITIWAVNTQ